LKLDGLKSDFFLGGERLEDFPSEAFREGAVSD